MFSDDPVIKVADAVIFQDRRAILKNLNFSIQKGEFLFLVGRTGSGKSSLLKILYADLPLYIGNIQVAGFDIKNISEKEIPFLRRKIGVIFQDFQLFPDRNIEENLRFVMKATGYKNGIKMKTRINEVLIQVGLSSVEKKMPFHLSGGEQQRVVIARALLNEPLILIADEPTGNLDPEVANEILDIFCDINKNGTAVLMATHSYGLIKKFPSRILQCKNQRVIDSKVEKITL